MSLFSIFRTAETPRQNQLLKPSPVTPPERPKPLELVRKPVPVAWQEAADAIGFSPAQLLHDQVRDFLIEQQIPIYEWSAVYLYMKGVADAAGANFFWRPLRQIDQDIYGRWNWGRGTAHGYYQPDDNVCSPYDKIVPVHILEDVRTIQERFGNKVAFFVTDYKADSPDPFILVAAPDAVFKKMVFGAWDEPGFGVV
jgi:hypothetical protein